MDSYYAFGNPNLYELVEEKFFSVFLDKHPSGAVIRKIVTTEATMSTVVSPEWTEILTVRYMQDGEVEPDDVFDSELSDWLSSQSKDNEYGLFSHDDYLIYINCLGSRHLLTIYVGGPDNSGCQKLLSDILTLAPRLVVNNEDENIIPVFFWALGQHGAASRNRRLNVMRWSDVEGNYTAAVRKDVGWLMERTPPIDGGRLILWHGDPGTGKSHAIRALAREWSSWCDINYIVDPEKFFGVADYMMSVLLDERRNTVVKVADKDAFVLQGPKRWNLLIVEDADEFLKKDAKEKAGQALSRLLNLSDGLIGQGLNVLTLITTNASLTELHPAVQREGRCIANTAFAPLSVSEANEWLKDSNVKVTDEATLAHLFNLLRGDDKQVTTAAPQKAMGQYL